MTMSKKGYPHSDGPPCTHNLSYLPYLGYFLIPSPLLHEWHRCRISNRAPISLRLSSQSKLDALVPFPLEGARRFVHFPKFFSSFRPLGKGIRGRELKGGFHIWRLQWKGGGGSPKSRRKEQNQQICDSDRGGPKNQKILRTSYVEAPKV